MNQEEIKKSLSDLIDETLNELEDLKKSRFSAAEIELKGAGDDNLAGKPVNGSLEAKKSDDKDEDDKEKKEDKKDEKAEDKKELEKGVLDEAEVKKSDDKEDKKDEDKEDEEDEKEMEKALAQQNTLMKSMIDERVRPIEDKLTSLLDIVNKMANTPVAPKGATYRVAPLAKSIDDGQEPLTKSQVLDKLFELKKSGANVPTEDITSIEVGQDINKIVKKYNLN